MLRVVQKKKMEALTHEMAELKKVKKDQFNYIDLLEQKVQELHDTIIKLREELEEEKDKYKKYMKQIRKKSNEAAKKWLNGYPDE
jgi:predicted  nucleic acid-binding Zn-ribbon protein